MINIQNILKLARLDLDKNQEEKITNDLEKIIDYVKEISVLNTKNIEPFNYGKNTFEKLEDIKIIEFKDKNKILQLSKFKEDNFIKLPNIL